MRRHAIIILVLVIFNVLPVAAQNGSKITREKYIETYSDLAMKEMKRTGIPASITLAQGCLESDNGNSTLSAKGNNHFGIKCHDWQGARMYHDDDEKDECFRKYKSAYESYVDHSMFLTTKTRYESLFDLKPGDYKAWARGLQRSGYATSNKYSSLLIRIIEENNLHAYDKMVLSGSYKPGKQLDREPKHSGRRGDIISGREILVNNRIEYIIIREGDTPELLRDELDLFANEIYRYNNLEKGVVLDSGMVIYLQPKRLRAEKGFDTHTVQEGDAMRELSQKYGLKLSRLYKMNNLEPGIEPEAGTELNLRKKIKREREPMKKIQKEPDQQTEMEFEFDGS